ncbi:hypothetical protein [Actinosynnema mirum]|uniref:Uncharacterized protein n=1 Tax=Actinosynnema mirum (strain ATCC 29888 / DSM 43827 / JCM 3225 / NBRC 14064 / NCIMB 13271 / NRRL B-12336 / IMRU 3971 / 101) TaxID=446462 RepID=C6WLK2_ACTMD|nr:hypothetical protein [Actinosynnema mirum]ACU38395.1 hypothetical protein Amir_4556 [Actinosynnema mirum DSM 43827]
MRDVEMMIDQVPDSQVRLLAQDAWRCYQAGVHRSAVTATWTAVITDIVAKIVWLAEEDDPGARRFRDQLRQAQQQGLDGSGISAMQGIEKTLLDKAVEFELLDKVGARMLNRIREDRNLCVHTSLNNDNAVHDPGEETARAHLVTALTLLLTHPPLGGNRLFDRFIDHVCDARFVLSEAHLLANFHDRLRGRTRRQIIEVAAKHALCEGATDGRLPEDECADRMAKALLLFASRDRESARAATAKGMGKFAGLDAEQKLRALGRLGDQDFFWDSLPADQHDHLKALVADLDVNKRLPGNFADAWKGLSALLRVLSLTGSDQARARLPELENQFNELPQDRKMLAASDRPAHHFVQVVVSTLKKARSFSTGGFAGQALVRHARFLDLDSLHAALRAWGGNCECYYSHPMPNAAVELFHATKRLGHERITLFGEFLTMLPLDDDGSYYYAALAETLQAEGYTLPEPPAAEPEEVTA